MFRMSIKKAYHERNQENEIWKIVISKNNQNHISGTLISMRIDAEHDETTPAISFDRVHENVCNLTKDTSNYVQKGF